MKIYIKNNPVYTIDVYQGSIEIEGKNYPFLLDVGESYIQFKWDGTPPKIDKKKLHKIKQEILKKFENEN